MTGAREDRALMTTRIAAAALLAGVIACAGIATVVDPGRSELKALVVPVAIGGLVSPVIGYRVYSVIGGRLRSGADLSRRCTSFVSATISALAVTEGTALLGIVVYLMSSDLAALTGVVTHVMLTGAIWPSRVRLESFLEAGPAPG